MSTFGTTMYLLAILHLQMWPTTTMQSAVSSQMEQGYVAGWRKL